MVRTFFMKKYFPAGNVCIFQLFCHMTLFFISIATFFGSASVCLRFFIKSSHISCFKKLHKARLSPSQKIGFIHFSESPFKMMFLFSSEQLFSFLICLHFCPDFDGYVGNRFDKKDKVNMKVYEVKNWNANNYTKQITRYLKKYRKLKIFLWLFTYQRNQRGDNIDLFGAPHFTCFKVALVVESISIHCFLFVRQLFIQFWLLPLIPFNSKF